MNSLTSFTYPVAKDGYCWVEAKQGDPVMGPVSTDRWITDGVPVDARWGQRLYHPLENPVLFRIFATTDPTEHGVKEFADKFGLLVATSTVVLPDDHPFAGQLAYAESLSNWHHHIREMRLTMAVWDAVLNRDIDALRSMLRVEPGGRDVHGQQVAVYRCGGFGFPGDDFPVTYLPAVAAGDLATVAVAHVHQILNSWLQNAVVPSVVVAASDSLKLQWRPLHLLGAMWLQFALAVDSHKQFRPCANCGTWFEISADGSRASRQYCSDACRMRAYRARKAGTPM